MYRGFVKIYRRLLEKSYCKKPQYVWLWVYLLLKANHKGAKFLWNGEDQELKAGQFIIGREKMHQETGIPESTIEDILKFFKRQHQIQQQTTNKFRIITIVNWHKFQDKPESPTSSPTTKQQQADTNKNHKNEKEESTALLKGYFASLCLEAKHRYAGSPQDEQRLRVLLDEYTPDQLKKIMEAYIKRPEKIKYYSINAALSSFSLARFEEEEKRESWQY